MREHSSDPESLLRAFERMDNQLYELELEVNPPKEALESVNYRKENLLKTIARLEKVDIEGYIENDLRSKSAKIMFALNAPYSVDRVIDKCTERLRRAGMGSEEITNLYDAIPRGREPFHQVISRLGSHEKFLILVANEGAGRYAIAARDALEPMKSMKPKKDNVVHVQFRQRH